MCARAWSLLRLQDAEVELVKLCQSVPKNPSEPLVLRSGQMVGAGDAA